MDWKRVISALLGFPLVLVIFVFGSKYIIDIALSIIAIISLHEYFNAISKDAKPVRWVGYICCLIIACIHLIPEESFGNVVCMAIPIIIAILFLHIILSEMRINFKDIAYTFFGIFYIVFFMLFFSMIIGLENGKILIWYALLTAWGTDILAYYVGKNLGKHHFSSISPKKTVEGCIGGILGAVIIIFIYTICINKYIGMNYSYTYVIMMSIILSIISQIGDFSASSIKRYVNIKDYSELIPGHGGMLDRIDSLLFIAPFAYMFVKML